MAKPYIFPKCRAAEDPRMLDLIEQLSLNLDFKFTQKNFIETVNILDELAENETATLEQCKFLDNTYGLELIQVFAECVRDYFGPEYPKYVSKEEVSQIIAEGKLKSTYVIEQFIREAEYKIFRDPIRNHPIIGLHGMFQRQYNTLVAAVCQFLSLEHSRRDGHLIYVTPPDGPAMLVDEDFYFGMSQEWCWHMYSPREFITYCREYNAYIPDLYAIKQFVLRNQSTPREELMSPKVLSSDEYDKLSEEEKFARAFPDPADKDRDKAKTYALDISEEIYKLALVRKKALLEEIEKADAERYDELQLELTVWADIVDAYDAVHDREDNELIQFY